MLSVTLDHLMTSVSKANDFVYSCTYNLLINEITYAYYSFMYTFDLLVSNVFTSSNFGNNYSKLASWYITNSENFPIHSTAHLKDIDGKANPYYNCNAVYIKEFFQNPLAAAHPELLPIHIFCRTYNINTSFDLFGFVPAEIRSVLNFTIDIVLGFALAFIMPLVLIVLAVTFLASIVDSMFSESKLDNANTTSQFLVESEKEITNLEDMLLPVVFLLYIFGWLFLILFFFFFTNKDVYLVFFSLPMVITIVLCMPLNILYDYGLAFSSFLRGAGATTLLILEFMYDWLATMIMLVRLSVQNIRFFLMFFAFIELFELIYTNSLITYDVNTQENFYDNIYSHIENEGLLFTIVAEVPVFIFKYLYQFLHLLFTLVSHFIAYLALVFWLFSFLYTCFVDKQFEHYFNEKRQKWQKK